MVIGSRAVSVERIAMVTVIPVAGVLAVAHLIVGGRCLVMDFARIGPATLSVFVLLGLWQNGFGFLRWLTFGRWIGVPLRVGEGLLFYAAGCGTSLTPAGSASWRGRGSAPPNVPLDAAMTATSAPRLAFLWLPLRSAW